MMAATKNGAVTCRGLVELGTVEVGKIADLLIKLPTKPVWSRR